MVEPMKILDVLEANAHAIAGNWAEYVKKNERTVHYQDIPKEQLVPHAIEFYSQLRILLVDPNRYEKAHKFFQHYAMTCHSMGIPLHESIYALNMMRRHMWLYADCQAIFINAMDHHHAIESLLLIMRMMDFAIYEITRFYQDRLQ